MIVIVLAHSTTFVTHKRVNANAVPELMADNAMNVNPDFGIIQIVSAVTATDTQKYVTQKLVFVLIVAITRLARDVNDVREAITATLLWSTKSRFRADRVRVPALQAVV